MVAEEERLSLAVISSRFGWNGGAQLDVESSWQVWRER